jgi:hypothetical protein
MPVKSLLAQEIVPTGDQEEIAGSRAVENAGASVLVNR